MASPEQPELLESAGGDLLPAPARGRGRRGLLIAGAAAGAAALLGVAAWGVYGFVSTGPQPADALPTSTLAYASIDLDPAGSQKLEAYQVLRRFPAIEEELSLDTVDDLRRGLFDALLGSGSCGDLDYATDLEPWLGARAAMAAVDLGGERPAAVAVVQVADETLAEAGLERVRQCSDSSPGWVIQDGWAVIAETPDQARAVVDDSARGTLADDGAYQRWLGELGDPGIVTMYVAPAAGPLLLEEMGPLMAMGLTTADSATGVGSADSSAEDDQFMAEFDRACRKPGSRRCQEFLDGWQPEEPDVAADGEGVPDPEPSLAPEMERQLRDFRGMAASIGFRDEALQLQLAADSRLAATWSLGEGTGAADLAAGLPATTAGVLALSFPEDWFGNWLDQIATLVGAGEDVDSVIEQFESESGLALPDDIEALLGDRAAVVFGGETPLAELEGADPADLPVGLLVEGDPDRIVAVLDTLRTHARWTESEAELMSWDRAGDRVAVGPDADYRGSLLADGRLGEDPEFQRVMDLAHPAAGLLYVNFDTADDWLVELMGDTPDAADNARPLVALGISGWQDGEVAHAVVRLSTEGAR